MKKAPLIFILLFSFMAIAGQEIFLKHYSINEGLPSAETYTVLQDSKGFIWIASDMGVCRYDGYNFKTFSTTDGLVDNTVFKLYEDLKGRIWFGSFSGKLCYFNNDTIYGMDFPVNNRMQSLLGLGIINSMQVDKNDTLLMSTSTGLFKIIPELVSGKTIWTKVETITTTKTVLVDNGYLTFEKLTDQSTRVIQYRKSFAPVQTILPGRTFDLLALKEQKDGPVFLLYGDFLDILYPDGKVKQLQHIKRSISLFQEQDSTLLIGEKNGGLHFYNKDFSSTSKCYLKAFSITGILKDRENGYWISTLENGVYYLASANFTNFENPRSPVVYTSNSLHVMPGNILWALTNTTIYESNGSDSLHQAGSSITQYLGQINNMPLWNVNTQADHELWFSDGAGITVYNLLNKKTQLISLKKLQNIISWDSRQLAKAGSFMWSLNHYTLSKIDILTKQVIKVIPLPFRGETICDADQHQAYIGTLGGLYLLTNDSLYYLGHKNELFKNRFVDLKRWGHKITGATKGAGIIIIDGDSVYQVTTLNGLTSNMCRSVFIDNRDQIWAGTNNGLNKIIISTNPFKANITTFSHSDGLIFNDILQVVRCGDILWLQTKAGLSAFNPDISIKNQTPPPVYITAITLDRVKNKPEPGKTFDYSTNFIKIDFIGLTYKDPGKQMYMYKLEGYDSAWNYTQIPSVQFTKLPPGKYRFVVTCINNSGIPSAIPAELSFSIDIPFYKKTWFLFILCGALIMLIALVAMLRVRSIRSNERKKTAINQKIANLELQALRAQMNPHFIFNCLAAIRDFIVKNENALAEHYLSSFSKLIRTVLQNSHRQDTTLIDELSFLRLYLELEQMRANNRFTSTIQLQPGLEEQNFEFPSMILQPFVENAIRHGKIASIPGTGELKINFLIRGNILICQVQDNGIGLKNSIAQKDENAGNTGSHALSIIKEHIDAINEVHQSFIQYTITDISDLRPGQSGTLVEIKIPLTDKYIEQHRI